MAREEKLGSLYRTLSQRDDLSGSELTALSDALGEVRIVPAGGDIVADGQIPSSSTLLISGLASRYTMVADGGRQITALHLAGDFVDLHSFPLRKMDHSVVALTDCEMGYFPHARLKLLGETHPHLNRMLWMLTLIDAAIQRQWLVTKGRLSALEQMAHLLCELHLRGMVAGLVADDGSFPLPLTQATLGDVLGLSIVHTNRTLQSLRRTGCFSWDGKTLRVLDRDRLWQLANFDPGYVHLEKLPR
jgi:CRP-like cAMP-binding protein